MMIGATKKRIHLTNPQKVIKLLPLKKLVYSGICYRPFLIAITTPPISNPTAIIATISITKGETVFRRKPNVPQKKSQSNTFDKLLNRGSSPFKLNHHKSLNQPKPMCKIPPNQEELPLYPGFLKRR